MVAKEMAEKKDPNREVVITVTGEGNPNEPNVSAKKRGLQDLFNGASTESSVTSTAAAVAAKPGLLGSSSPESTRLASSHTKPPKVPIALEATLSRRRTLTRSVYSKPKSRFGEQHYPVADSIYEENGSDSFHTASPNNKSGRSITKTSSITSSHPPEEDEDKDEEDEEIYKLVEISKRKRRRVRPKVILEWAVIVPIAACLVASLVIEELGKYKIWGLEVWRWCVLMMVTFCGLLVTHWFMHLVVFLIEKNFLLRKKVLYFVHGLKKSVQVFIWMCFVLFTWVLLFLGVKRTKTEDKILAFVTWSLVSILVGTFLCLLKTLLLKILASKFHMSKFFDRIQESVFDQYVLQTLSGPPLVEQAEKVGREPSTGHLSFSRLKKKKGVTEKKTIDMGKVHKMKQEKVSAWTLKVLMDAIMTSGLSTISNDLDESAHGGGEKEITNEMEATAAAFRIFRNIAKPGCSYIDEDDLLRFMIKMEVDYVFPLFDGAETGKIDRKALTNWVVKVYTERKALAHALTDTKTAVKQLDKVVMVVLVFLTFIIWLILMEIATTKILLLMSSQIVAASFLFGSSCKTLFESIIFVFVMHPFDVGDRCVVDGIQLLVEEMNLLTTVFLKPDNEKVYYPNSVLATKPISNCYRSPDMGDAVEFSIDFATSMDKLGLLKEKIKNYLENTPQLWYPNHNVVVKEIVNVNSIKMVLFCTHTMNFQDIAERSRRRTELVLTLKGIFEEIEIKYSLLPQGVHLRHV